MNLYDKSLNRFFSTAPPEAQIPKASYKYVHAAMTDYAESLYSLRMSRNKKRLLAMLFGNFAKLTWQEQIIFFRIRNLRRVKKMVQGLSNENNRKYYVIRSSEIGYKYFSSTDVKRKKKLNIFKRSIDEPELREAADVVIYPQKQQR